MNPWTVGVWPHASHLQGSQCSLDNSCTPAMEGMRPGEEYSQHYLEHQLLGEGGFGKVLLLLLLRLLLLLLLFLRQVYRVTHRSSLTLCAAKHIKTAKRKSREGAEREVAVLRSLACPYIIRYEGCEGGGWEILTQVH